MRRVYEYRGITRLNEEIKELIRELNNRSRNNIENAESKTANIIEDSNKISAIFEKYAEEVFLRIEHTQIVHLHG